MYWRCCTNYCLATGASPCCSIRKSFPAALSSFPLHSPVLEPDLHLALREVQGDGNLVPPQAGEVITFYELSLQLGDLLASEGSSLLPRIVIVCNIQWREMEMDGHIFLEVLSKLNKIEKKSYRGPPESWRGLMACWPPGDSPGGRETAGGGVRLGWTRTPSAGGGGWTWWRGGWWCCWCCWSRTFGALAPDCCSPAESESGAGTPPPRNHQNWTGSYQLSLGF